jgi:pimeloyl-ACP methyl ester carboxylesterase
MSTIQITEHVAHTGAHTTFYLACGPQAGPLIIFVHGWPELSLSWRHQLPVMAALGFRCIAPDMRGYGQSSIYKEKEDYALERSVGDMIDLLDHLGWDKAIWVGHDWGSPVVWNIASHHPHRCHGVANLCVPYSGSETSGFDSIDRTIYPEDEYPAGQWEYMLYYYENFDKATAEFDANVRTTLKGLFRKGDPSGVGKPAMTAMVRKAGGFFGDFEGAEDPHFGLAHAKDLPVDEDVISEEELQVYTEALEKNGFFGPSAWYVNMEANGAYAATSLNGGTLEMPVLFIGAMYDYTCETITSRAKEPMIKLCGNLTLDVIKSGHWMAQEKPVEVNGVLAKWLATKISDTWPQPG